MYVYRIRRIFYVSGKVSHRLKIIALHCYLLCSCSSLLAVRLYHHGCYPKVNFDCVMKGGLRLVGNRFLNDVEAHADKDNVTHLKRAWTGRPEAA